MTDMSSTPTAQPIVPVPEDAPRCPGLDAAGLVATYKYRDEQGQLLQYIMRIEERDTEGSSKPRKRFVPWTYVEQPGGKRAWEPCALPAPRPLYGLDRLAAARDRPVLMVEGEKCTDALAPICHDAVVITWPGGSNAVGKIDLTPLSGRDVVLLPDHDEAGRKAMMTMAERLGEVGAARVRCIDMKHVAEITIGDAPKGCDIADLLAAGMDFMSFDDFSSFFRPKAMVVPSVAHGVAPPPESETNEEADAVHAVLRERFGVEIDLPEEFEISSGGVTKTSMNSRGQVETEFLASPLYVVGRTRTGQGGAGWGALVAYRSPLGEWETVVVPATTLTGDGREMREILACRGVTLGQGRVARQTLMEFVGYAAPREIVEVASRTGWCGKSFVLPNRVITPPGGPRVVPPDLGDVAHRSAVAGTLEGWQAMAADLGGTSRGVFALSVAICAPLAEMIGETGGGFHLWGPSSRGKTTLLASAASVWGGGGRDGAVQSWSMTANGGEATAALHSGTLLALDEIHLADQTEIRDIVYRLANGQGKSRARRDGSAKASAQWHAMILSSGEVTIATRLGAERRGASPVTGGLAVRMIDVPHSASEERAFERIGNHADEGTFVRAIRAAALRHYGHAGPAFVARLVADPEGARNDAIELIEAFVAAATDNADDPQVVRVARRFGLACAGGTLASRWGVVPWPEGTAHRAALACFRAWLANRGTTAAQEEIAALRQVAAFFEAHGTARFEEVSGKPEDEETTMFREAFVGVRDRCGYRGWDAHGPVHYVLPYSWKNEVCADLNPDFVARLLRDRGALLPADGAHLAKKVRLPDFPNGTRVYAVRSDRIVEAV